jgi:hypothetical protein
MITDRAVERISRLGPVSSRVVDLNKPSFRPLPWRQSRNFNAADGTLRMDGQSLRFPKRADYENPKVFDLGGRTWLIDRNSVQWIEAADRWRVRREIDLGAKSN